MVCVFCVFFWSKTVCVHNPHLSDSHMTVRWLSCRQLSKVQYDFQSLLEMAIIMLHLEVRCHCFYFLLPTVQKVRGGRGRGKGVRKGEEG